MDFERRHIEQVSIKYGLPAVVFISGDVVIISGEGCTGCVGGAGNVSM